MDSRNSSGRPLLEPSYVRRSQTPIDIEGVKNIHFECTLHSLFTLIDEGPPPILRASHLSFSVGRCLQPDSTATTMAMKTRRAIVGFCDFWGVPDQTDGGDAGLLNIRVLPLELPQLLMDVKHRSTSQIMASILGSPPYRCSVSRPV